MALQRMFPQRNMLRIGNTTSFPRSAWERTGWSLGGPASLQLIACQSKLRFSDAERRGIAFPRRAWEREDNARLLGARLFGGVPIAGRTRRAAAMVGAVLTQPAFLQRFSPAQRLRHTLVTRLGGDLRSSTGAHSQPS